MRQIVLDQAFGATAAVTNHNEFTKSCARRLQLGKLLVDPQLSETAPYPHLKALGRPNRFSVERPLSDPLADT